ncbi:MAG: nucleotide sugar dehydrogenase, partial [Verrucomicrobiota bacterium]
LECLRSASESVGRILRKGAMVVYESTVYPGVTEEFCLPILEQNSGLKLGEFDLGYSPERVNPGDREHTIDRIMKIVSGHDEAALKRAVRVYGAVIHAGLHEASSIMTAEAAKVIENVQRDLNIALMNELSRIFSMMNLNTREVLDAAGTKWNFHKYHPGLVGGHCIGVDPYYLTQRALDLGYRPEVILAGRQINDSMGAYIGEVVLNELECAGVKPEAARVWVMGMTFKENVPDLRNTRAVDIVQRLQREGVEVTVWEPLVDEEEIRAQFDLETVPYDRAKDLDVVVIVNAHDEFKSISLSDLKSRMRTPILIDIKNLFSAVEADALDFQYFCL